MTSVGSVLNSVRLLMTAFPLMMLAISAALAADCVEDRRTVKFADGQITKLRSYRCEVGGAKLNVEFHRLSDIAASLLLSNKKFAEFTRIIPSARIQENVVSNNFMGLIAKGHAVRDMRDAGGFFSVSSPGQNEYEGRPKSVAKSLEFRTISWASEYIEIPASAEESRSLARGTIPKGYFFYFDDESTGLQLVPKFWRSLESKDITGYKKNLERYVEYFGMPGDLSRYYSAAPRALIDFHKAIGGTIPPGLVPMKVDKLESFCEDTEGIDQNAYFAAVMLPDVIVETILIKNKSSRSILIDDVLGDSNEKRGMREYRSGDRKRMDRTGLGKIRLSAGESVLVPLGILFISGDGTEAPSKLSAQQKANVGKIARKFGGSEDNYKVMTTQRFAFGEQYSVNGLSVDGRKIALAGRSANYTAVDFDLEGSCPYLSTLRRGGEWVERGKVLHLSNAPELEARETYSYDGFIERIRLDEREAERAVLRSVEAQVLLEDGRKLPLQVSDSTTGAVVGEFALNWGDRIEMHLHLPEGVEEDEVTRTEIVVQGYYERYSRLAANMEQRAIEGVPATAWRTTVVQCSIPALLQ